MGISSDNKTPGMRNGNESRNGNPFLSLKDSKRFRDVREEGCVKGAG